MWVSAVKAMVPEKCCDIIDEAIQMHGAAGISQWFPLAEHVRTASARCAWPTAPTRCTTRWWVAPSHLEVPRC
jgi:alkylation response protein AidB-like acyl-CoA dehydrogenase